MVRVSKVLVIVGLLTFMVACGGAAPTATPPPTATPAPTNTVAPPTATVAPTATTVPPTATVAPTNTPVPPTATIVPTVAPTRAPVATVAPTRAATTATSGAAVTDSSGKCRMTLDPVFVASPGNSGTYVTADDLAILTFAGTDTPGLNLDAATTAFIGGFQSVVTGYVETGRETSKDARGDVQLVSFTGAVSGQQAKGVFYFVQSNNVLCSLVALAIPPGDTQYGQAAQRTADTLRVVGATASGNPAPAAPTVAPTRAPVATVAPTRVASPAPVAGGGTIVIDSSGKCQMALPANFKAGASKDNFQTADNLALITLGGTDTGGLSITDAANLYAEAFKSGIDGYVETSRRTVAVNGGQEETITYNGTLVGQPV